MSNSGTTKVSKLEEALKKKQEPCESTPLLTWFFGSKESWIIRDGVGLNFKGFDSESGKDWSGPIDGGIRSIENTVLALAELDMTINDENDAPVFSRLVECDEWPESFYVAGRELKFIWKDDNLMWRVFSRSTKTISLIQAGADASQAMECLGEVPIAERTDYLKNFKINMEFDKRIFKLISASIEQISGHSKVDPSKSIDRDNWAITLIVAGCSRSKPKTWSQSLGHALIAYEGIENGQQFLEYAHLTAVDVPYPQVEKWSSKTSKGKVNFKSKSETWIRTKYWTNLMINKIKREEGKPRSFQFIPPFKESLIDKTSYFCCNGKSIHKPEKMKELPPIERQKKISENCLTWGIETVEHAGIKLPPIDILGPWPIPATYIKRIGSNPSLVTFTLNPE